MSQIQPSYSMEYARQRHLLDTLPRGMWRRTVINFVLSGYSWQDACRGAYMQLFHIVLPPVPYKPTPPQTTGVYVLRLAGDGAPGLTPLQAELASRTQEREHREEIAREVSEIVTQTPTYRPQVVHLTPLDEPQVVHLTPLDEPQAISQHLAPPAPSVEEARHVSSSSSELGKVDPLDRTEKYPALAALRHSA